VKRARLLLAVFVSIALLSGNALSAGAEGKRTARARLSPAGGRAPAPPGVVIRGLAPSRPGGPCHDAGFELRHGGKFLGCTHGPDPAPQGAGPRSEAELQDLSTSVTTAATAASGGIKCSGDGTSGKRVQAIYAYIKGRTDRSATIIPLIRMWAAQMSAIYNASAAETNGSRQIRWVHSNSSTCQLTVSKVTLPTSTINNFSATVNALRSRGFNKSNRKYSVWMDVPRSQSGICGIGQFIADERPGTTNKNNGPASIPGLVARTDRDCWGLLSDDSDGGGFALPSEMTEAHELGHTLGAVQRGAPHSTHSAGTGPPNGHCFDEWDTMCYDDDFKPSTFPLTYSAGCLVSRAALLDCGHNDYFHTNPTSGYLTTHWNPAKNGFLLQSLAPGNDRFAGAMPLVAGPGVYTASNRLATAETGEPTTAGQAPSHSLWFTIKPTANGVLTVDTDRSKIDTVLGIYTGSAVNNLSMVGEEDDESSGKTYSRLSVSVTSGTTYRIKVDGKGGAQGVVMLYVGLGASTPVITGFSPTSGPPGTNVTITGTNIIVCPPSGFCDPDAISFDGIFSTTFVTTNGSTSITVKVPGKAKDGPITLNDDRGATISDTNFNVT
jgi:hypothetical protein